MGLNVKLGDYNSTGWNLDFLGYTIDSPTAKTNTVSIPLRDGIIDMTESLGGYVRFNNRNIKIKFELRDGRSLWPAKISTIRNAINGKIIDVVFPDDTTHAWRGRIEVSTFKDNTSTAYIEMTLSAYPFKHAISSALVGEYTLTSTAQTVTINVTSGRKYLVFGISGTAHIDFDGDDISLTTSGLYADDNVVYVVTIDGTQYAAYGSAMAVPGLYIGEGSNVLSMTGSGTLKIWTYDGSL